MDTGEHNDVWDVFDNDNDNDKAVKWAINNLDMVARQLDLSYIVHRINERNIERSIDEPPCAIVSSNMVHGSKCGTM